MMVVLVDPLQLHIMMELQLQTVRYNSNDIVFNTSRVLFDNMFNIVLLILVLQMLSGIIIDTFSKLREDQENIKNDIDRECFICGRSRDELEKDYGLEAGFLIHTERKHSIKNYLFFLFYIYEKPALEFNGTESFIHEKINKQDNSWFPCYYKYVQTI
jgi:inositol 1,4,5-triphosphate receptor type 3